jgi:hypothetical protein
MSDEYYAEDTFGGGVATSKVYTGPFLTAGFSMIIGSFAMASITKVWWLQVLPCSVHCLQHSCQA